MDYDEYVKKVSETYMCDRDLAEKLIKSAELNNTILDIEEHNNY